jgi:hypothetical protein
MSTAGKNFFVEHRVKALANVFLMGRNSIATYTLPDFGEIDMLARYLPEGDEQEKLFGVILKGASIPLTTEQAASSHLNQWRRHNKHIQKFPFPVLILIFSMHDDSGYYDWQLQPVVSFGNEAELKVNSSFTVQKADKKALDAITKQIDAWYEKQLGWYI